MDEDSRARRGLSSAVLFDKQNPLNPINRRISIIVLNKETEDAILHDEGKLDQTNAEAQASPAPAVAAAPEAAPTPPVPATPAVPASPPSPSVEKKVPASAAATAAAASAAAAAASTR